MTDLLSILLSLPHFHTNYLSTYMYLVSTNINTTVNMIQKRVYYNDLLLTQLCIASFWIAISTKSTKVYKEGILRESDGRRIVL